MICSAWTEGNAHILSLIEKYALTIKPPLPEYSGFNIVRGELVVRTGFAAEPESHSVLIREIQCEEEYWAALHEIGHCIDERARKLFFKEIRDNNPRCLQDFSHDVILDIEAAAWKWAIVNSIYELDSSSIKRICYCLINYADHRYVYNSRPHKIESDILWTMLNY